jgi:hypothetical protein
VQKGDDVGRSEKDVGSISAQFSGQPGLRPQTPLRYPSGFEVRRQSRELVWKLVVQKKGVFVALVHFRQGKDKVKSVELRSRAWLLGSG